MVLCFIIWYIHYALWWAMSYYVYAIYFLKQYGLNYRIYTILHCYQWEDYFEDLSYVPPITILLVFNWPVVHYSIDYGEAGMESNCR